jgi:hypothetical protein
VSIALGVLLAAGVVVLVALPFLRDPAPADDTLEPLEDEEHVRLVEERDRALAALKELEFDHRAGTLGDEDYRALVGPLRRDAAAALRALERYGARMETPDLPPEPAPPPDEGTPPMPPEIPEPYPPPDEITIPSPDPPQE